MSNLIFNNQSSSPDAVGSGKSQVYAKTDGIVYKQVGTDAEVDISGPAGLTMSDITSASSLSGSNVCAKAWVNFNGTSTLAIRASYNVASVTDNGTGDYTVNFATAMANDDYVACGENARSSNITTDMNRQTLTHTYGTGAVSIKTGYPDGINTLEDSPHTTVVVFGS
jgi:hypothetical protein